MKKFFKIVFGGLFALVIGLNMFGIFNTNTTAFAVSNTTEPVIKNAIQNTTFLNTWYGSNFDGLTSFSSINILKIYDRTYAITYGESTYLLNSNTNTWSSVSYFPTGVASTNIVDWWYGSDGVINFSNGSNQYYIRSSNYSFGIRSWTGLTSFNGRYVWTTPNNTYYSYNGSNYILNGTTWSSVSFSLPDFTLDGQDFININDMVFYVKSNGVNNDLSIYYFDEQNLSFVYINNIPYDIVGSTAVHYNFWSDGYYYYLGEYRINATTNSFNLTKINFTYNILFPSGSSFIGQFVWSDGYHIYYNDISGSSDVSLVMYNNIYYQAYNLGYDNGYNIGYDLGYRDGATGTGSDYDNGYNYGYNLGLSEGENLGYNSGYSDGYNNGVRAGYNNGYNDGVEAGSDYSFLSLIGATIDAPIKAFTGLFNFEIFGTNISNLLLALFTGSIIIVIIKFALGGK